MENIDQIRREIDEYYLNWFRLNRAYDRWAQQHGTSDSMMFTLYTISCCGENGCTQNHICSELLLPKQTVSFILSKLEKQGMLLRKTDPKDRRNNLVFLTSEGKAYAHQLLSKLEAAEIAAYQSMSSEQRTALMEGHAALTAAIEQSFGLKE